MLGGCFPGTSLVSLSACTVTQSVPRYAFPPDPSMVAPVVQSMIMFSTSPDFPLDRVVSAYRSMMDYLRSVHDCPVAIDRDLGIDPKAAHPSRKY